LKGAFADVLLKMWWGILLKIEHRLKPASQLVKSGLWAHVDIQKIGNLCFDVAFPSRFHQQNTGVAAVTPWILWMLESTSWLSTATILKRLKPSQ
jgi:hypothetical protein